MKFKDTQASVGLTPPSEPERSELQDRGSSEGPLLDSNPIDLGSAASDGRPGRSGCERSLRCDVDVAQSEARRGDSYSNAVTANDWDSGGRPASGFTVQWQLELGLEDFIAVPCRGNLYASLVTWMSASGLPLVYL